MSDSCHYHLDMQSDGNLVLYEGVGNQASQARWSTTQASVSCDPLHFFCESNVATPFGFPTYAILQSDGNFVEYDTVGFFSVGYPNGVRWDAGSVINTAARLWMQDDGNLVIYPAAQAGLNGWAKWASNTVGSTARGPRNCPMHSEVTTIDQDTIFGPSTILGGQCSTDAMSCGDTCAGSSGGRCAGWTWIPDATAVGATCAPGVGACVLLATVGDKPAFQPGCVTGVITRR